MLEEEVGSPAAQAGRRAQAGAHAGGAAARDQGPAGPGRRPRTRSCRYTLREAREHIAALRDEVDKLTQPPSAYGVVVGKNDDGTVDVLSSGRKMRVALHPEIDLEELERGPGGRAQRELQRHPGPHARASPARSSRSRRSWRTACGPSSSAGPTRSGSASWPTPCAACASAPATRCSWTRAPACCSRSCPGPRSRTCCSRRCPTSPTPTSAASTPRSSRSPTPSSCRSSTRSCSPSTGCRRPRASCSTARPAAARR